MKQVLPPKHIVERYFDAVSALGVFNDQRGLDVFIAERDKVDSSTVISQHRATKYIALVIGGSYFTKKIPLKKLEEICARAKLPLVIMGGKEDKALGDELQKKFPAITNTCGKYSLNQSASLIQQAEWVITSDTGLMHMAAAFNKKIVSVWGNTIPEFGMGPYLPNPQNKIIELQDLSCRPCSKLGYKKCPKGHFKCMNDLNFDFVSKLD